MTRAKSGNSSKIMMDLAWARAITVNQPANEAAIKNGIFSQKILARSKRKLPKGQPSKISKIRGRVTAIGLDKRASINKKKTGPIFRGFSNGFGKAIQVQQQARKVKKGAQQLIPLRCPCHGFHVKGMQRPNSKAVKEAAPVHHLSCHSCPPDTPANFFRKGVKALSLEKKQGPCLSSAKTSYERDVNLGVQAIQVIVQSQRNPS